jgi:hypothetical protein
MPISANISYAVEWPRAEDLLAGPRGRRLCWSFLEPGDYRGWDLLWDGAHRGNLTGLTDEPADCVAHTDLDSTVVHADQLTLLAALMEPVQTAMYWQEPDDDDYALNSREVRGVATGRTGGDRSSGSTLVDISHRGQQPAVCGMARQHGGPPALTATATELAAWRTATIEG